jgi:hypothetical protein
MQAISYGQQEVGKFIKATKVKHSWLFILNNRPHTIDVRVSRLGGTIELKLDSIIKFNAVNLFKPNLAIPVRVDDDEVVIQQNKESFDLLFRGNRFDCYCKSDVVMKSHISEEQAIANEARELDRVSATLQNQKAPLSSFYLPQSLLGPSNYHSRPVPEVPLDHTPSQPIHSNLTAVQFNYSQSQDKSAPSLKLPVHNHVSTYNPMDSNTPSKKTSFDFDQKPQAQSRGYSPFDSNTFQVSHQHSGNTISLKENQHYNVSQNSRAQSISKHTSIKATHFLETRGVHFLDVDFPKGTENIDKILSLIYPH